MKITKLETFVVGDGLDIDPDKGGVQPLALIRVHTDAGISGFSEVFSVPPAVVQAVVGDEQTHFGHLLKGQEITHPERIWQYLWDAISHSNRRGWQVIILGALDVAIWDIYGKSLGKPVWQLLGGSQRGAFYLDADAAVKGVKPYCTIVSDEWGGQKMIDQQTRRAEKLAELGYLAFKAEPMMSPPRDIVAMAKSVRKAIGPDRTLMIDVGYHFHDLPGAEYVSRQLEEHNVFFFETPFPVDNPELYGQLAARTKIPIAMGEHAVTRWEFIEMMDRGGVRVAQPYITTCGGFSEAKRIVEHAVEKGALVCPGNWSTQILGTASVHLAAYSPVTPFVEYAPAEVLESPLRQAIQDRGLPMVRGELAWPTVPGVGYDFPEEIARKYRL